MRSYPSLKLKLVVLLIWGALLQDFHHKRCLQHTVCQLKLCHSHSLMRCTETWAIPAPEENLCSPTASACLWPCSSGTEHLPDWGLEAKHSLLACTKPSLDREVAPLSYQPLIPAPWVTPRGTLWWQRCSQAPPAPAHPRLSSMAPKWMSGSDEISWPWGIPIFLPCTLWCGRLTPPAPLHLPIKPFRFSKLAFSPNISSTSLFRNRLSVFGRILFLMRALAMPVSRRLPKPQPESPPCSLLHQTLPR